MPIPPRLVFATPEAAEQAFYDSLNRGDVDALMQMWADDEAACCIHPGGVRLAGLDAIQQSWRQILEQGGMNVSAQTVGRLHSATMAVHQVIEEITITDRRGVGQVAFVAATNVYLAGPHGWALVMHHGSPLADPISDTEVGATLH